MQHFRSVAEIQADNQVAGFKRRLLAYVSGPYRSKDEAGVRKNINHAGNVALLLWKMGYAVICPHLNSAHLGFEGSDHAFIEGDMAMVERSDLVVMLPEWNLSKGAQAERWLAIRLGIPVYYWDTNEDRLKGIASNDKAYRDDRRRIVQRTERLAAVTGWRPVSVHPDDDPASPAGDGSGATGPGRVDTEDIRKLWDRFWTDLGQVGFLARISKSQ